MLQDNINQSGTHLKFMPVPLFFIWSWEEEIKHQMEKEIELCCFILGDVTQAGQLSGQIMPDTHGLISLPLKWFHSGFVFFILFVNFCPPFLPTSCLRGGADGNGGRKLQPLSWISLSGSLSHSERYRCRNKGTLTHAHIHIYAWGIVAAGQTLRNSVKSVLKLALFYNWHISTTLGPFPL